ncbi:hypothetical protein [Thiofilum flexile]|uniref:hypothetical protein n=1 Tax=Thiofilum flexile TaxID=125627 RepID=UPI00037B79E9|nr:hypothetical protein [Thiofilum flexile]
MTQKCYALMMSISMLMTSYPLFAVDSEALGEELKKGQSHAETQKPSPKKSTQDEWACIPKVQKHN